MPDRLYAATPARLATYLDCPRRYRLAYLDRPAPARTAARGGTSLGASVHTALARWWTLPLPRRTPEAGAALLAECWIAEGFRDAGQARAAQARTAVEVERYLTGVDPAHEPLAVERTVSVRTEHASLWGRVDRLDDRGEDGLVVVDYKTGRRQPSATDAGSSQALAVYAAGAAATFRRRCRRVELHHVPTGTVAAFEHDDASLEAHLRLADETAATLAGLDAAHPAMSPPERREAFPARVAPRCGSCEMRPSCGPGQSVPADPPWSGVAG
jgi:RecB family exonuclease